MRKSKGILIFFFVLKGEEIGFFGHRWLAKELYSEAGIGDTVEVE